MERSRGGRRRDLGAQAALSPAPGPGAGAVAVAKTPAPPPVVVLDTNLVLSALVFAGGRLLPLRVAWRSGRIVLLVPTATASELMRVLDYPKFKLSAQDRDELLADYLPHCRIAAACFCRRNSCSRRGPVPETAAPFSAAAASVIASGSKSETPARPARPIRQLSMFCQARTGSRVRPIDSRREWDDLGVVSNPTTPIKSIGVKIHSGTKALTADPGSIAILSAANAAIGPTPLLVFAQ